MDSTNRFWTLQDLRSSLPAEKNRSDSYWTRWVLRPLSYPISWLFLQWGWSANAVSYLSAVVAILGGLLLSLPYFRFQVWGAILLNLFAVLDCADGNVARVTRTTGPWGAWADALGGYVAYVSALLGAGMAAEVTAVTQPQSFLCLPEFVWPQGGWVFLGALAASANLLMRLTYQQYRTLQLERGSANIASANIASSIRHSSDDSYTQGSTNTIGSESGSPVTAATDRESPNTPSPQKEPPASEIASEKRISENLGVTGLLMPAILFGVLTKTTGCVVLFYTVLYGGGALVSILRLARKVEAWKRSP
jgi:hypothetical protein